MKFSRIAVCAGCDEVLEIGWQACPSCGDRASFLPAALIAQRAQRDRARTLELVAAIDQQSAVRAGR